jgi:hypothetical protein
VNLDYPNAKNFEFHSSVSDKPCFIISAKIIEEMKKDE